MIIAQDTMSSGWLDSVVAILLCAAFVLVAPAAWRIASGARHRGALLAYGAAGVGVVFAIGWVFPRVLGMPRTFLTTDTSLAIEVALFWVGGWGLGRAIDLEVNLERERRRAADLERQAEHAQMLALRAHLDPHFLFNTLNAIAEWCRHDAETAETAIVELAGLLRAILPAARATRWPLSRELALVESLWSLHRLRDPGRFEVVWSVPGAHVNVDVPPLLLLPLAENAMTHGPCAGHRGRVELSLRATEREAHLRITNPGGFGAGASGSGSGLATVRARLERAYDGRARLAVYGAGERTVTDLHLPLPEELA